MWCLLLSTKPLLPQLLSRLKEKVSFLFCLYGLLIVNTALVYVLLHNYMKQELIYSSLYSYFCNIYVYAIFLIQVNLRSIRIGNPE